MRANSLNVLVLLLGALPAFADEGWHEVRRETGGLVVEARPVAGCAYEELRVRVRVPQRPAALAEVVWTWRDDGVEARMVERRKVLSERANERVVYQVVRPPLVSRRQSVVRFTREDAPDGRLVHISFDSVPGELPEHLDAVRVGLIRGDWRFESDGDHATWLDYRCVSDPGGGLPAWLVANAQQDLAVAFVREVMALAR